MLVLPLTIIAAEPQKNQEKILILTDQLFPLNYTAGGTDEEPILGYATQLVQALMEESKLPYNIVLVPWARLVRKMNNTENVMDFSVSRTTQRDPLYHWIGEIIPVRIFLFGKRSNLKLLPRTLE